MSDQNTNWKQKYLKLTKFSSKNQFSAILKIVTILIFFFKSSVQVERELTLIILQTTPKKNIVRGR
jgi:hypothetical protein